MDQTDRDIFEERIQQALDDLRTIANAILSKLSEDKVETEAADAYYAESGKPYLSAEIPHFSPVKRASMFYGRSSSKFIFASKTEANEARMIFKACVSYGPVTANQMRIMFGRKPSSDSRYETHGWTEVHNNLIFVAQNKDHWELVVEPPKRIFNLEGELI